MGALKEILFGSGVSAFIVWVSIVVAVGTSLGRIKIRGVSLGAAGILIAGIAASHFGASLRDRFFDGSLVAGNFVDPTYSGLVQELGLIFFLYAVGLQSGKNFFKTFKKNGLTLNLLAASVVAMNVALALVLYKLSGIDMGTIVGILSGAVTNTPGLGAAQTLYQGMGNDPSVLASAYAAAYPLGVLGIIFTIIAIRFFFKIDLNGENRPTSSNSETRRDSEETDGSSASKLPPIVPLCVGMLLGVAIGNVPIAIPGVPQTLKLGTPGGALVAAIIMSAFGEKLRFPTRLPASVVSFMQTLGVSLFLACVGLRAGETFVETVANGGLVWVGLGAIITIIPLMVVGVVGYAFCKVDYCSLSGVLAGSMTDPPALSYSRDAFKNEKPNISYAAVNPLAMFLRIVSAQLLIMLFA